MICEQCKSEGKKSTIIANGGGMTTLACTHDYYDEDGKRHYHDPNYSIHGYQCSNGHTWTTRSYSSCWCGYNKESASL